MMDDLPLHMLFDIPIEFNLSLEFNESFDWLKNYDDSLQSSLSEEDGYQKRLFLYYLMGIAGTILCSLGILCNILSIIVLTRRVMRSSTYSYLTALALSDTFFLCLTILLLTQDTKKPLKGAIPWVEPYYAYMFSYVHTLAITCQVTSIWLTLAFTVDRYIMICHPFKAEQWCSISRARKVILCLSVAGLLFNFIRFFEYRVEKIPQLQINGNVTFSTGYNHAVQLTELGGSVQFREIVHSWLYLTCVAGIPFLSLLILNIFLIHAVHKSRKKGREINANERRRNDTTIMLISVIILFLLCQGPALISRMIWAFDFNKVFTSVPWNTFNEISNFLVIVNSAINIVPYYFFGRRFRREFWRLFCKCLLNSTQLKKLARSLSLSDRRQSNLSSLYEMDQLRAFQQTKVFKKFEQACLSKADHQIPNGVQYTIDPGEENLLPEKAEDNVIGDGKLSSSYEINVCYCNGETKNIIDIILRVGVATDRYVSLRNARLWVMHGFRNTRGRGSSMTDTGDAEKIQQSDSLLSVIPNKKEESSGDIGPADQTVNSSDGGVPTPESTPVKVSSVETEDNRNGASKLSQKSSGLQEKSGETEAECMEVEKNQTGKDVREITPAQKGHDGEKVVEHSPHVTRMKTGSLQPKSNVQSDSGHAAPALSTYDRVRLIILPWKKPEGYLNKPVFKMMIESLLFYVMSNPGTSFHSICAKYNPFLQPFHILLLLEVLEEIGCIKRIIIRKKCVSSLFSTPTVPQIVEDERDGDEVFFEAMTECIIKLGHLLEEVSAQGTTAKS